MDTKPLSDYMKAVNTYKAGDKTRAGQLIADSLGLSEPTDMIKDSLKALCNSEQPNEAIVTLLMHRLQGGDV